MSTLARRTPAVNRTRPAAHQPELALGLPPSALLPVVGTAAPGDRAARRRAARRRRLSGEHAPAPTTCPCGRETDPDACPWCGHGDAPGPDDRDAAA